MQLEAWAGRLRINAKLRAVNGGVRGVVFHCFGEIMSQKMCAYINLLNSQCLALRLVRADTASVRSFEAVPRRKVNARLCLKPKSSDSPAR